MKVRNMLRTWACTLSLIVALTIGTATPVGAVQLAVIDSAFDQWTNVSYPDGFQPSPFAISGESLGYGPSAYLDLVFEVSTAGDTDTDQLYELQVMSANLSDMPWYGFIFALGFGVGDSFEYATFAEDPQLYIAVDDSMPTSSDFGSFEATSELHPHELFFYDVGSVLPSGSLASFNFFIHVPLPTQSDVPFTLRQYAAPVPEPSTFVLLGAGILSLAYTVRRRRKL